MNKVTTTSTCGRCDKRLIAEGGGPPELFNAPPQEIRPKSGLPDDVVFPGLLAGDSPLNDWIHGVQP